MAHDHAPPPHGANHTTSDHLHSHVHDRDDATDLQVLTAQFIDGFVQASDKAAYLNLAGIALERPGQAGKAALKLVDVELRAHWQVGTASPSFGSRELSYLPFPGSMIRERTNLVLVYVSLEERLEVDIREVIAERANLAEA
ncbi:MAG: hypothetical protein AAF914_14130 [Pseudomonadota bacterium]